MSKKSRTNKSTFPGRYTGELATPIYEPVAGVWVALAEARPRPSGEPSNNEFSKWRSCLIGTRSIRMSLMPGCVWP